MNEDTVAAAAPDAVAASWLYCYYGTSTRKQSCNKTVVSCCQGSPVQGLVVVLVVVAHDDDGDDESVHGSWYTFVFGGMRNLEWFPFHFPSDGHVSLNILFVYKELYLGQENYVCTFDSSLRSVRRDRGDEWYV